VSFQWNNAQDTVHPLVIHFTNADNTLSHTICVRVSDSLSHDAVSVHLYQKRSIQLIMRKVKIKSNQIISVTTLNDLLLSIRIEKFSSVCVAMRRLTVSCTCELTTTNVRPSVIHNRCMHVIKVGIRYRHAATASWRTERSFIPPTIEAAGTPGKRGEIESRRERPSLHREGRSLPPIPQLVFPPRRHSRPHLHRPAPPPLRHNQQVPSQSVQTPTETVRLHSGSNDIPADHDREQCSQARRRLNNDHHKNCIESHEAKLTCTGDCDREKRKTCAPVREGALHRQNHNCLTVNKNLVVGPGNE
jgi:hypothetical protein